MDTLLKEEARARDAVLTHVLEDREVRPLYCIGDIRICEQFSA
jgi:hypothetical protein